MVKNMCKRLGVKIESKVKEVRTVQATVKECLDKEVNNTYNTQYRMEGFRTYSYEGFPRCVRLKTVNCVCLRKV